MIFVSARRTHNGILLVHLFFSLLMWRRSIKSEWRLLVALAGVPGAVAVAFVLTLPVTLEYWYTVQSMVFGVVLFGLLVQRTAFSMLLRKTSSEES